MGLARNFLPAFAAMIFGLSLVQCTNKSMEYGLNVNETIRLNLQTEPPSLDWSKSSDTTSDIVISNIMEGLIAIDINNPELPPIPALASDWSSSPDAKTWTFTLRKGVKWSDGADFTAQNVVDSWERMLSAKAGSPYSYLFYPIHNAEDFYKGKLTDFSKVGIRINDKGQIVVHLDTSMSYFPLILSHHSTFPIRKDLIQKYGEDKWTEASNMVGLGPYRLKIWEHDKALVLERNDGYWGPKAKTKNVIGYMINEYSTAVSLFQAGKLDYQETLPWNDLNQLKTIPGFHSLPLLGQFYLGLNTRKPPFNDVKVRKAFAMAIDRSQVTNLLGGGLTPLSSWVPRGMFGHEPDIGLKFNPEAAQRLLDEAGFKDRSKFPRTIAGFNTNENNQRIIENIQAQLKKNLGINVEIQNEEWKVYLNHLLTDPPNIYRLGWVTDYPDPESFLKIMIKGSENNYTGWYSPEYDELVKKGCSALEKSKRKEFYAKAQKILIEDAAPVFPVYSMVYPVLVSPRLKNFPLDALDKIVLKDVTIQ